MKSKAELDEINRRRNLYKYQGWRYCKTCRSLEPRTCRKCGNCPPHCSCETFDKPGAREA